MLVHCLDGVSKSGLFLAAFLLLQKMKCEGGFDVVYGALAAQDVDPRFVAGTQQFECLFKMIRVWTKTQYYNEAAITEL